MALSTGWKVGIGIAAVGVAAWVVALMSTKPAKASAEADDENKNPSQEPPLEPILPLDLYRV